MPTNEWKDLVRSGQPLELILLLESICPIIDR